MVPRVYQSGVDITYNSRWRLFPSFCRPHYCVFFVKHYQQIAFPVFSTIYKGCVCVLVNICLSNSGQSQISSGLLHSFNPNDIPMVGFIPQSLLFKSPLYCTFPFGLIWKGVNPWFSDIQISYQVGDNMQHNMFSSKITVGNSWSNIQHISIISKNQTYNISPFTSSSNGWSNAWFKPLSHRPY